MIYPLLLVGLPHAQLHDRENGYSSYTSKSLISFYQTSDQEQIVKRIFYQHRENIGKSRTQEK